MARVISMLCLLGLIAAGLGAAVVLTPGAEERLAKPCNSCSLRHQRLKSGGEGNQ